MEGMGIGRRYGFNREHPELLMSQVAQLSRSVKSAGYKRYKRTAARNSNAERTMEFAGAWDDHSEWRTGWEE
jgi:hypothetical protein